MASWIPRGTGTGGSGAQNPPPKSVPPPAKPKKREKWLVTRKTWRYMADAGKLLLPESMRKGKETPEDLAEYEEHFQNVCDQQTDFIEWEGPKVESKAHHLARVRPTIVSPPPPELPEPATPSFRLVLPVGQEPPPGYIQVGRRTLPSGRNAAELELANFSPTTESYVRLPSGLVVQELPTSYLAGRDWLARRSSSPVDSGVLSPEDRSYDEEIHFRYTESGIGSGTDSVIKAPPCKPPAKRRAIGVQTDPLPEEYFRLLEEQKRREEEEKRRKEEEERLAKEAEEKERKEMEELEAAMMGDSVMRYLKMVRRNSKTSDQKKAERFRSMNYDPTLRNIKAKYLNKEDVVLGFKKSFEVQVGESLLGLLLQCKTPVDPPTAKRPPASGTQHRKFSSPGSEISDSAMSPQRRLSITGGAESGPAIGPDDVDGERDFFSHLYSGDMTSLESGAVPEDYYNYLESWYRAQKGLCSSSNSGAPPSATSSVSAATAVSASIYIPVDALQNLRASMPTLATSAVVTSTTGVSRSTISLGKSSAAHNFISTVISARPWASIGSAGGSTGKIISKKLWRPRSKGRQSSTPAWTPQVGYRWAHISNRQVILEPTNLLLLHEFERVAIQKVSCQKLNNSDLGVNVRIPKEGDSKQKRRTYLLKKKVLNKWDGKAEKTKDSSCGGAVFGVPLSCCVETTSRKRSTQLDVPDETSPASKSLGSLDNLSLSDLRRVSTSGLDAEETEGVGITSPSSSFGSLCVPTVVMMCIRHLEQFGLHTVGVFRVSSSKKRVRQLKDDFDRGGQITLTMETGVHDVATLLKEFFRDLPEPIIPKDLHPALLAIQKLSGPQEQLMGFQRMMQLLPVINRDTLYVVLQFLGLVADNAEDRKGDDGSMLTGNKMDASNLATLFAPNLLHNFAEESAVVSSGSSFTSSSSEKLEYVSIMKTLIEKRDSIFEVPTSELHDLYVYLHEHFPDVLDALLCRRLALAGVDIPEDVEEYDEEEEENQNLEKTDSRRRGRFRKESDGSEGSSRWGFRRRDRSSKEDPSHQMDTTHEGITRGSFKFPGAKSRKLSADAATISDIFRRKASTKSASEQLHSPSSGTPSSDAFFGGSGNTTPSVTSPPPQGGPHSGFSSPLTFSPPMSPPPLQPAGMCSASSSRLKLGNVFAPAADLNASLLSHQPIVLRPVPTSHNAVARRLSRTAGASLRSQPLNEAADPRSEKASATVVPQLTLLSPVSAFTRTTTTMTSSTATRSKTDDLDRYISQIESPSPSTLAVTKDMKKYTRRRYTDSRHPTTELPDVSSEEVTLRKRYD